MNEAQTVQDPQLQAFGNTWQLLVAMQKELALL